MLSTRIKTLAGLHILICVLTTTQCIAFIFRTWSDARNIITWRGAAGPEWAYTVGVYYAFAYYLYRALRAARDRRWSAPALRAGTASFLFLLVAWALVFTRFEGIYERIGNSHVSPHNVITYTLQAVLVVTAFIQLRGMRRGDADRCVYGLLEAGADAEPAVEVPAEGGAEAGAGPAPAPVQMRHAPHEKTRLLP